MMKMHKKIENIINKIKKILLFCKNAEHKIQMLIILYVITLILVTLIPLKLNPALLIESLIPIIILGFIIFLIIKMSKIYEIDFLIITMEIILVCLIFTLIILYVPINFSVFQ